MDLAVEKPFSLESDVFSTGAWISTLPCCEEPSGSFFFGVLDNMQVLSCILMLYLFCFGKINFGKIWRTSVGQFKGVVSGYYWKLWWLLITFGIFYQATGNIQTKCINRETWEWLMYWLLELLSGNFGRLYATPAAITTPPQTNPTTNGAN